MDNRIFAAVFRTPLGWMGVAARSGRLIGTWIGGRTAAAVQRRIRLALPGAGPGSSALLAQASTQLVEYARGWRRRFSLPVEFGARSAFARRVLRACAAVPFGERRTYGQLASAVGRPGAARAVGAVLRANPLPLVIPCHRVVAADGRLCGFSAPGGVRLKARLLAHESAARA